MFLVSNRAEYHFITSLIQWLPILFFPLVVVLAYSTTERMPLDVLFYSLRRQKEPVNQSWDMSWVFFGLLIVAAGATRDGESWYLVVAATLIFGALLRVRPSRYSGNLWLLLAMVTFLAGTLAHHSIRATHLEVKELSRRWLAEFIDSRTNPMKTKSAIGTIGRLKTSDKIEFRIKTKDGGPPPRLLQEATYDSPSGTDWLVLNPGFEVVEPVADFTWRFRERVRQEARANIYLEFDRENALVPVPANVTEIFDLPAIDIRKSRFGSIQARQLVASPGFEVAWHGNQSINDPPDRTDLFVPPEYQPTLEHLLPEEAGSATDARHRVFELFQNFQYSLYQDLPRHRDPLVHFLTEGRAGHCEYFASAAVLALRQLGVPARYAVGYSVQEYDQTIDMYVVRKRHAHAWAIAWIDDRWQVVDTTPQVWSAVEAGESGPLQPIADLASNGIFMLQLWWSKQRLEDYETELYIIGGILVVILIWRIATSEQVRMRVADNDADEAQSYRPGFDSPFFRLASHLEAAGYTRERGETFERWVRRIGHDELSSLVRRHNRLRFDPRGASSEAKAALDHEVDAWLAGNDQATSGSS
ncbi:MAG: transglutaminase-like domain-containing protein [Gammaproteobacteria bacterium]|nr:transglutaminase-like domain-containing protein [Gammaproteobacteria bacterium]